MQTALISNKNKPPAFKVYNNFKYRWLHSLLIFKFLCKKLLLKTYKLSSHRDGS